MKPPRNGVTECSACGRTSIAVYTSRGAAHFYPHLEVAPGEWDGDIAIDWCRNSNRPVVEVEATPRADIDG